MDQNSRFPLVLQAFRSFSAQNWGRPPAGPEAGWAVPVRRIYSFCVRAGFNLFVYETVFNVKPDPGEDSPRGPESEFNSPYFRI